MKVDNVIETKKQVFTKGESYEENHYLGNGFSDDACICWWMLAMGA